MLFTKKSGVLSIRRKFGASNSGHTHDHRHQGSTKDTIGVFTQQIYKTRPLCTVTDQGPVSRKFLRQIVDVTQY